MDEYRMQSIIDELRERFDFKEDLVEHNVGEKCNYDISEFTFASGVGAVLYYMINPGINRSAKEISICISKSVIPQKCDVERAASHLVLKNAVSRASGLIIAESEAESIDEYIECLSKVFKRPKIREYMEKYVPISFGIAEKLKYDITVREFQKFVRLQFDDAISFLKNSMHVRIYDEA
jgi:hypothetical protein